MKYLDDKVSSEHREKVLAAAETELAKIGSVPGYRFQLWQLAGGAIAAAAGILLFKSLKTEKPDESLEFVQSDPEMLKELSLLEDLDFWQNLDIVESLPKKEEG